MSDELELVFMPALSALLIRAEQLKTAPLTREEVTRIRDEAVCMAMKSSVARQMEHSRGHRDIDPENCWEEWQNLRIELNNH